MVVEVTIFKALYSSILFGNLTTFRVNRHEKCSSTAYDIILPRDTNLAFDTQQEHMLLENEIITIS